MQIAMPTSLSLLPRDCPVCGAETASGIPFLDRHFDPERLNDYSFASRKRPEHMCYTMLRCLGCDVVYACESPADSALGDTYQAAAFDSKQEAIDAADTYERALSPHFALMTDRTGALDIGTGTGVFLQRVRALGFTGLIGVEPSRAAIDAADADIRRCIREGMFEADRLARASLSLITCFMTLEHVAEPARIVRECCEILRPGGLMACVVHDWRARINRLLGRHSPIVDVQHLQLFSRASVRELYRRSGFVNIECSTLRNRYRLDYWNRLLPAPAFLNRAMELALRQMGLDQLHIAMNVGNLLVTAWKPAI